MAETGADFKSRLNKTFPHNEFYATLDSAAEGLGQQENRGYPSVSRRRDRDDSVNSLINAYVDRVYEKTGQLPTEAEVGGFVNESYSPTYATDFTLRRVTPATLGAMVDSYVAQKSPPAGQTTQTPEDRILGLVGQLNKVYDTGKESLTSGIEDVYGKQKRITADDLAGQGMLTNPNSRYNLNEVDASKNKAIASGLNTLEGARASGNIDLSTAIENILANERRAGEETSRFNKNYRLASESAAFDQGYKNRALGMADRLGRLQAGAQSNSGLAGLLGGGLSGAGTGFTIGGPWGAAIGGIAGSAMGYASTKKG